MFVNSQTEMGGAEISLLSTLAKVDRKRVEPVVATLGFGSGNYPERLRAVGLEVHELDAGRARNPFAWAGTVLRLRRLVLQRKLQVVVSNGYHPHYYGAPAAWLSGVKTVLFCRDFPNKHRIPAAERIAFLLGASLYLTASRAMAEAVKSRLGARRPVQVIPNGVDTELFRPRPDEGKALREELGMPAGSLVVTVAGRLQPWKGQHLFIEAAALVAAKRPDVHFAIVGDALFGQDADYPCKLSAMVRERGLEDRFAFAGMRTDMAAAFSASDVVVHSSIRPEPFGRVIVEAMACGTPVVVASDGGAVELFHEGTTGLGYEPGNASAMAACIVRYCSDACLRSQVAEAGRRHVEANYSAVVSAQALAEALDVRPCSRPMTGHKTRGHKEQAVLFKSSATHRGPHPQGELSGEAGSGPTMPGHRESEHLGLQHSRASTHGNLAIVSGTWAPTVSGVADHTRALALELSRQGASTGVVIASPGPCALHTPDKIPVSRLEVAWTIGGACRLANHLAQEGNKAALIFQYVPHLYGRAGISIGAAIFPLLARRKGFRILTHFHEVCAPWSLNPLKSLVALIHRVQAWLLVLGSSAVSFSTRCYARRLRMSLSLMRRPWAVLPSGPTSPPVELTPEQRARERSRWCSREQRLGVVYGLATRAKRYDLAIEALALLRQRDIDLHLLMLGDQQAGDRDYCTEIRQAARRMGIEAHLSWSGRLTPVQVSETLAACDFMWHLNRGGLTLRSGAAASAFAQGLPVIAFEKRGLDDCFRDGDNVLLVKKQDAASLADATAGVLSSDELAARLGSGAACLHREKLSWPAIAAAHLELLRRMGIRIG